MAPNSDVYNKPVLSNSANDNMPSFKLPSKLGFEPINASLPGTHPGSLPTSQIELTISCRNLLNLDITSKSDPFCIVKMKETWQDAYFEVGRTETIKDNLNPEWVKKFVINYSFETVQKIKFEVYDVDPGQNDFLGEFETTIADIVPFAGTQLVAKLTGIKNKNCGQIVLVTEEVAACKQTIRMQFEAKNLEKMMWLARNDPFLVLSRLNGDGSYSVVHKTEAGRSQNYRWKPIEIHARTLCNGRFDRAIKIDCYDRRGNGDHKLIGTCQTSVSALRKGVCKENRYVLRREDAKKDCGRLVLVSIDIADTMSFIDYIRGGTQMHFAVAIDFTASNRPPQDPRSLHFLNQACPNQYETALRSVGEIIQHYNSSKIYPAFGFGAEVPPSRVVSHQFPLNGNQGHPYCSGVDQILHFYRNCLTNVIFHGPTNFSPVINSTISIANQFQDGKHYFVLLIITDGIISDMRNTKQAIINASKLPISIIIVGVGDADFDNMNELDSDDRKLKVDGQVADRDIVQFVPMKKFLMNSGTYVRCQAELAKEVLSEIPAQVTGYMRSKGFKLDMDKPKPSAPIL